MEIVLVRVYLKTILEYFKCIVNWMFIIVRNCQIKAIFTLH